MLRGYYATTSAPDYTLPLFRPEIFLVVVVGGGTAVLTLREFSFMRGGIRDYSMRV